MKKALSISIGSSIRDKSVKIRLLGQDIHIQRIGTDGDMKAARRMFRDNDGKVHAFGVGGIDLGLFVDNKWYKLHSVSVDGLFVVGLPPEYDLNAAKPLTFIPDAGDMFDNIQCGLRYSAERHPGHSKCFIVSADIPALRPEMVDWMDGIVEKNPASTLYYNVIPRSLMETQFPDANRSYVRFKDITVCSGGLNVVDINFFQKERPVWKKLTQARKHPLKQASLLGFETLLLVALHMITLEKAVSMVCRRLMLVGKVLVSPYAELGMDADKPHQLKILRQTLGGCV